MRAYRPTTPRRPTSLEPWPAFPRRRRTDLPMGNVLAGGSIHAEGNLHYEQHPQPLLSESGRGGAWRRIVPEHRERRIPRAYLGPDFGESRAGGPDDPANGRQRRGRCDGRQQASPILFACLTGRRRRVSSAPKGFLPRQRARAERRRQRDDGARRRSLVRKARPRSGGASHLLRDCGC